MAYHTELYNAIKANHAQDALTETAKLIYHQDFYSLEITWIYTLASLGEYTNVAFEKWLDTCKFVANIITENDFAIKDAFIITTKLCLLYKNSEVYIVFPKHNLQTLRSRVIDYFSEKTKLSESGIKTFQEILPKPSNENSFCKIIIGGLIKLWTSKEALRFKDALEYLCRKDYIIESLPTETEENITSFIWSFLKVFLPEKAKYPYILFKTHFQKKEKSWRNLLLYTFHNALYDGYGTMSWTVHELHIIENVEKMTPELWEYITGHYKEHKKEEKTYDSMHIFESYMPLSCYDISVDSTQYTSQESKNISIRKKHKSHRSKEKVVSNSKDYNIDSW